MPHSHFLFPFSNRLADLKHEPKEAEFLEFCRVVYGDDPVPCHVTFEKVYKFFYYVVHRQVRPRGKKKGTSGYFNLEEYNRIWSATRGSPDTDTNHVPPHLCFGDLPEGEGSSPGYDCFNQYKCAIKKLHEKNLRNKTTGLDWNQEIWTPWCKDLELLVKRRKGVMKKVHHKEKMNPDHTLLKGKGKDKLIEEEMWTEGFTKSTLRNAFGSIRHRLMFLFTLSGVLRMESLHSAELSDCFLIKGRNEAKESQDWDCLIMQMCDGKTNRGKVFYGRSMRHKNVLLCPIGALGFYLLSRFKLSGEFEEDRCPDFTDNSAWYDIKLLVSFGTHNGAETAEEGRKRPIKPKNFSDSMREILGKLGIPSTHLQHLGRLFGNMNLQYLEIDEEFIRMLGNWAVNIRDQCYSTHLPLKAMRAAAGFTTSEGRYYNPRALVVPPEELEKKIFPFADRALEKVEAACKSKGSRMGGYYLGTARGFLEMLLRLRTIILQDAAAMKVLHPERCDGHMFFQAFPELFRNQLFLEYTAKMRLELSHAVEVRTATVDAVLPGVIEHFNSLGQGVRRNGEDIMEVKKDVNDLREAIPAMMRDTTLATWQAAIMRDTMLATWQSLLSGMTSMVGDMRSATATAPSAFPALRAMQQQTIAAAANPLHLTEQIRSFTFESQHNNLKGMWDEWHGLGNYKDMPMAGGVAALEELHGAKWRGKNIQQRVSRQGRICLAIKKKSEAESKSIDSVCNEWNEKYAVDLNKNMRSFVQYLQNKNWIPVHARRGRRSDT